MTRTVQNPQLRDAFTDWLQVALPLLKPLFPSLDSIQSYPWLLRRELIIPDTPFSKLPETQRLLAIIHQIPEFAVQTTTESEPETRKDIFSEYFVNDIVADLIKLHVTETSTWEYDPETFTTLYSELEQYLYNFSEILIRTTYELWHVESDITPILLSPQVAIRHLTDDERIDSRKLSQSSLRFGPSAEDPPVPELLIELTETGSEFEFNQNYKSPRLGIGLSYEQLDVPHRILLALRLVNAGTIWVGFRHTYTDNRFLQAGSPRDLADDSVWRDNFGDLLWNESPRYTSPSPYFITHDVAQDLHSIWPVLSNPISPKKLNLPLRRFRYSYDRKAATDRLIDHWIALEALFASNEQEIAYKVSQRIAQFVGTSPQERWDIFSTAKKSYEVRSRIVHGDEFKNDDLLKHSIPTENYLRRSLLKCLLRQQMPSRKQLEQQIFLQETSGPTG